MFTDGYIANGRQNPSPELNGPTCGGMAYDVVKKNVKPGDIIIIPAGVVHGWLDIPEHVDYLSFRPSPGILTAGFVHPVLKKYQPELAGGRGRRRPRRICCALAVRRISEFLVRLHPKRQDCAEKQESDSRDERHRPVPGLVDDIAANKG